MRPLKIIIIIIVILLIGYSIFKTWRGDAEDEKYVLANDHAGPVIVLYDQADGQNEKYSGTFRIYEIPYNGILKTKFKFQEASRQVQYVTKSGKMLRYLWPSDRVWSDTSNVSSIYKDSIYVFKATTRGDFIVGKPRQLDSLVKELNNKWQLYSTDVTFEEGDSTKNFKHNKVLDQ